MADAREKAVDGSRGGKRREVSSYLPELLVLANETGRRLSAILGLTYEDLDLERRPIAPNGAITWRADLDKKGIEWQAIPVTCVCSGSAGPSALRPTGNRGRASVPARNDPSKPMDRHLADRWLREAEKLAGLELEDSAAQAGLDWQFG